MIMKSYELYCYDPETRTWSIIKTSSVLLRLKDFVVTQRSVGLLSSSLKIKCGSRVIKRYSSVDLPSRLGWF